MDNGSQNEIREYVETVQDRRESTLLALFALADGMIPDPDTLDPEEDADEIAEILEQLDGQEWLDEDSARERLDEFGLGMDTKIVVTLDLGVGGPSDWIELTCTKSRAGLEVESAAYHSAWGTLSRARHLTDDSALYRWAESQIELLDL